MFLDQQSVTRRGFVHGAFLAAVGGFLQSCFHRNRVLHAGKLTMPGIDPSATPLTIDTHCHIFNGSDLQAKEFIARVVSNEKGVVAVVMEAVGEIIQVLEWGNAPTADEEISVLQELSNTNEANLSTVVEKHRSNRYLKARDAIQKTRSKVKMSSSNAAPLFSAQVASSSAARRSVANAPAELQALMTRTPTKDDVLRQIYASFDPPDYEQHKQTHTLNLQHLHNFDLAVRSESTADLAPNATVGYSVLGMIRFIGEGFQYRIVDAQDYLDTFTKPAQRSVDLIVASMVDFDWWLTQGSKTPTPLYSAPGSAEKTQLDVMEQISIVTNGQVHGFAAFDPLREVAFRAGKGAQWSSRAFVQEAITKRGCVGVKLYPPMGFAAYGNSSKPNDFWEGNKLPDWLHGDISYNDGKPPQGLGARMDEVLGELYAWCSSPQQEVPILAHSNQTNGVTEEFKELVSASYWKNALTAFPNLRVSFGHLGDFSGDLQQPAIPDSSQSFIDLFASAPHAHGDSGFDAEVLREEELLAKRYQTAYGDGSTPQAQLFAQRLMYGTDWNLVMVSGDIGDYEKNFVALFEGLQNGNQLIDGHKVKDRFFGWNAVEFLGLKSGDRTRQRLEDFYTRNGLDFKQNPPLWMAKVDKG